MAELTAMSQIIRMEQNAYTPMEFVVSAFSDEAWAAGDKVGGQVPPQIIAMTLFGIYVGVDSLLPVTERSAFMDQPITNLF